MSTEPVEALLPCPFCGSSNIKDYVWNDGDEKVAYFQCADCSSCGPDHNKGNLHWNRRASQSPAVSDPPSVREALRELVDAQEARLVAAARSGIGETGGLTNTIDRLDAAWINARSALSQAAVPAVSAPEPVAVAIIGQTPSGHSIWMNPLVPMDELRKLVGCKLYTDRAAVPAPDSQTMGILNTSSGNQTELRGNAPPVAGTPSPRVCAWSQASEGGTDDVWDSGCGHTFTINDGSPLENDMRFCCFCGRNVKEFFIGSGDAQG